MPKQVLIIDANDMEGSFASASDFFSTALKTPIVITNLDAFYDVATEYSRELCITVENASRLAPAARRMLNDALTNNDRLEIIYEGNHPAENGENSKKDRLKTCNVRRSSKLLLFLITIVLAAIGAVSLFLEF